MTFVIRGMGTAQPETSFFECGLNQQFPIAEEHPTTERRMRIYAEQTGPLAVRAACHALDQSGLNARDITHLITVSSTGFVAPGVDLALLNGLHLSPTVERTHVGSMGCPGALNGLQLAATFAHADPAACVLLCAVELGSLQLHPRREPQNSASKATFTDGAAVLVGMAGDGEGNFWRWLGSGSFVLPDSADAMTWTLGDHGFEITLSQQLPRSILQHLWPWLMDWLKKYNLTISDIPSWAIQPGLPTLLDAVEKCLHLRDEHSYSRVVGTESGNMSSSSVLFILECMHRLNSPRPCVVLAFAPGLVAEAALLA